MSVKQTNSCFSNFSTTVKQHPPFNTSNPEDVKMLQHLYNRLSFGARKADIDWANGKTIEEVVDTIIDTATDENIVPVPDENVFFWAHTSTYADPFLSLCENTQDNPSENGQVFNPCNDPCEYDVFDGNGQITELYRSQALESEWLVGMIGDNQALANSNEIVRDTAKSFKYKLSLFWHNHFVAQRTGAYTNDLFVYYFVLQNNALKNFKQFVKEIGFTPMMMNYLNTNGSKKDGPPNENYPREFLELFTMGVSQANTNQPNYEQSDIAAMAKVLTGWLSFGGYAGIINQPANLFDFDNCFKECQFHSYLSQEDKDNYPFQKVNHEWGSKTFSAHFGNAVIPAVTDLNQQTRDTALNEYFHLIDNIIFSHRAQSIAYHICAQLYKKYVFHFNEYDELEQVQLEFINQLATGFEQNWDIANLLKKLFKSEHFYDPVLRGCQIKSPVEYFVSYYRSAGLEFNKDYFSNYVHFEPGALASTIPNDDYGYINQDYPNPKKNSINAVWMTRDCQELNQELYNPPNVGGWQEDKTWLNEYTYVNRWVKLQKHFDKYFVDTYNDPILYDAWESIRLFVKDLAVSQFDASAVGKPEQIVEAVINHFFVVDMSLLIPNAVDKMLSGVPEEEIDYWNIDANGTGSDYDFTREEIKQHLKSLFVFLIQQPEFNLI